MKYLLTILLTFCISFFTFHFSCAQPGSLDNTFDSDGILLKNFSFGDEATRFVISQPDGKILLGGYFYSDTNYDVFLLRLNSDGSTDSSFDNDGFVSIDFYGDTDVAASGALQPDGKIVITGYSFIENWSEITVARLNNDGSPDSTFSADGKTSVHPGTGYDLGMAMAIQPDGKILVAGTKEKGTRNMILIRFNNDGSVDSTFESDGIASPSISGSQSGNALSLQPDGKILVAGASKNQGSYDEICIVRYTPDGYLDTTFSGDGIILQDLGPGGEEGAWSVALQQDEKIVVACFTDFTLLRYHSDGLPDSTFSNDGIATFNISEVNASCLSLKISAEGKIIAVGMSVILGIPGGDFALLRCNPDGTADSTFGINGVATININYIDFGFSTDIQPDGKILIAGTTGAGTEYEIMVARVLSEVATEAEPAISGKYDFSIFPNPSSNSFTTVFFIPENSAVSISLLDAGGRKIKTVAQGNFEAGNHQLQFEKENLSPGLYLLQLKSDAGIQIQKLVIQ